MIKGSVIGLSIIELNKIIESLKNEIKAVETFQNETAESLSRESRKVVSDYILKKKEQKKRLVEKTEQIGEEGKKIIGKITGDE